MTDTPYLEVNGHYTIGFHHCNDCEMARRPPRIHVTDPFKPERTRSVDVGSLTLVQLLNLLAWANIDWLRLEAQDRKRLFWTLKDRHVRELDRLTNSPNQAIM